MKKYVIGNWKCHKTSGEGCRWFDDFAHLYRPRQDLQVVIAPPMVNLETIAHHLHGLSLDNVSLAAQDISPFPAGSYTGAVAADMVKSLADYVIIGHSERRRYFHETGQDVLNKVAEASDSGLCPLVCVESVGVFAGLTTLADIECDRLMFAYTPVDAQNFTIPETPARVEETVAKIRQKFPESPVVYGGALRPANVGEYLQLPSVAGVFIGAASLDAQSFAAICNQVG